MEITKRELPATIGINHLEQGVYEFDMVLVNLDVQGFACKYILPATTPLDVPAQLYLRQGNEKMPDPMKEYLPLPSIILGNFEKLWVEGTALKGRVVIVPAMRTLFDRMLACTENVLYSGVTALVEQFTDYGKMVSSIKEPWGAQVLTADGSSLREPRSESWSPLYPLLIEHDAMLSSYLRSCGKTIATSKYLSPVTLPCLKVIPVKGLDEHIAALVAESEKEKPYGKMFLTVPKETIEEDSKDGA